MRTNLAECFPRLLATLAALAALVPAMALAPEPDPVPTRWQLDLRPGDLRVMHIETPQGSGAYLYLTYSATNNTGEDLQFVPSFEMATNSGPSRLSGLGVPAAVTRAILDALQHPFMQDQINILGPIQQGPENAKHGLVVWPLEETRVNEIRVFAAGFSGETETIRLTDPATDEPVELLFRKTMMLRFDSPGEIRVSEIGNSPFPLIERRWIMR